MKDITVGEDWLRTMGWDIVNPQTQEFVQTYPELVEVLGHHPDPSLPFLQAAPWNNPTIEVKHFGPGPHGTGSPQAVHGSRGGRSLGLGQHPDLSPIVTNWWRDRIPEPVPGVDPVLYQEVRNTLWPNRTTEVRSKYTQKVMGLTRAYWELDGADPDDLLVNDPEKVKKDIVEELRGLEDQARQWNDLLMYKDNQQSWEDVIEANPEALMGYILGRKNQSRAEWVSPFQVDDVQIEMITDRLVEGVTDEEILSLYDQLPAETAHPPVNLRKALDGTDPDGIWTRNSVGGLQRTSASALDADDVTMHDRYYTRSDLRREAIREVLSDEFLGWTMTSNGSVRTLARQRAVQDEFYMGTEPLPWTKMTHFVRSRTDAHYKATGTIRRKIVRAEYEHTQQVLRELGISEIEVARGFSWGSVDEVPEPFRSGGGSRRQLGEMIPDFGDEHDIRQRPLSSWTTDANVAELFAAEDDRVGAQVRSMLPVQQMIFVMHDDGENEIIVLGPNVRGTIKGTRINL